MSNLFEDGRVVVPEFGPLDTKSVADGDAILSRYEKIYRLELPEPVPEFHPDAGRWAAICFFRFCQLAIYRNLGSAQMEGVLNHRCPVPRSPEVHYSVDLVLQYLPDLTRYATLAAEQDPLLEYLRKIGGEWPLSSVGMPAVAVDELSGIIDHAGLLRLYVDRVISTGDASRLQHPSVERAVRQALGFYPQLAQDISDKLHTLETQDTV